jgi:hypothetical protein
MKSYGDSSMIFGSGAPTKYPPTILLKIQNVQKANYVVNLLIPA